MFPTQTTNGDMVQRERVALDPDWKAAPRLRRRSPAPWWAILICVSLFLQSCSERGGVEKKAEAEAKRGMTALESGDARTAVAAWTRALSYLQRIKGSERKQAACLENIASVHRLLGEYEESVRKREEALALYSHLPGTERDQARCLQAVGLTLAGMKRPSEAISKLRGALAELRSLPETELEQGDCLASLGAALSERGYYEDAEDALQAFRDAQEKYNHSGGTDRQQADCLANLSTILVRMGRCEEALAAVEEARRKYATLPSVDWEQACCLKNVGLALEGMGRYEEAVAKEEEAQARYARLPGTERDQAGCLLNMGVALDRAGRSEEAIVKLQEAISVLSGFPGTERMRATCLNNIGCALYESGRFEESITKHEEAWALQSALPENEKDRLVYLATTGMAQVRLGLVPQGIERIEQASKQIWGWWILREYGLAMKLRGQPGDGEQAVHQLWKAMQIAEELRSRVFTTETRINVFEKSSSVYRDLVRLLLCPGRYPAGSFPSELAHFVGAPESESAPLEAAFHLADRGKGRALEDALREKASLTGTDLNMNLLAQDKELSLQISKLTRLREDSSAVDVERKSKLTQQIDELQLKRNLIEVELKKTALGGYVAPEFRKPIEMARELPNQTAVLQYSVGEKESWLLILTREGVTAHRVGADTATLPGLLSRRRATLGQLAEAWQKQPDKIGLEGLVQLARMRLEDQSRRASERYNRIDSAQEQVILARLGEVVLPDSALSRLRQEKVHHLLVIPDGALHYVPFAMIRVKDESGVRQYLIEQYAVSYIQAMTTLETIRKQAQERQYKRKLERCSLLAFANPSFREGIVPSSDDMVTRLRRVRGDYYGSSGLRLTVLPETEQEAMQVASLFGAPEWYTQTKVESPTAKAVVCTAQAASEDVAKRLLAPSSDNRQWQYLLFSTHGLADMRNGMLSCLALSSPSAESSEDGFLQAQEILGLELDCDLVMLSACQTGLGKLRSGEGLVGLSGAFFYAGAESVCASLWQVPSGPTSQLTTEFFRNLKAGELDKAEALRQAQLAVLRSTERSPDGTIGYSDPFCWAAFVLTGEWK